MNSNPGLGRKSSRGKPVGQIGVLTPWIHSAGAIPSSLHQKVKFIVEEKIITVKGEEDYAIYKETSVPYISVGDDENLPFHSFETISVIRDYGEVGPSRADRMIGKVLLHHNYIPGTGLGARGQGINRPVEVEMYFDGAVNSTGSGVGALLISPDGHYYPVAAKIDFPCTNNVAEYEACILGLQAAIDFKVKELEVFGDSMLIIFQTLGQWKTKDAKLVPYHDYLEKLTENFEDISFTYTLRMTNQFADALATLASMVGITKETLSSPSRLR
ncbi:hypothetical protein CRG98_042411 [Punica granatum]|uniref:RNase H type-1 domain-containing protein n=1 Tax=Punica granatum TaxID=22663 RepID=A0A2I0HZR3_PUNGR|nr:hypothetical protein CRG98_042411 [Punica granatum]